MEKNGMRQWLDENMGKTYTNFINGEWKTSVSGNTSLLKESARELSIIGHFPDSVEVDVDQAVQAAYKAFQSWKKTSSSTRSSILFKFASLLEENKQELAYMLSAEQGKVLAESLGEIGRAVTEIRFAAGEATRINGATLPSEVPDIQSQVQRYPIGVVAAIAPWNFPVVTPIRKIAPALAYGCTVVYKPASVTPWTSIRIMELLQEAGVPDGVVNMVIGSGRKVGSPLVEHPLVKGVSFTGSTKQGMNINQIATSRLAKTQLELGGKNAAIVLDYDQLQNASKQIVGAAFACSGQRCTAISRVIVLRKHSDLLIKYLKKDIEAIQVGPAWDENSGMGPLINKQHFESVVNYLEIGKEEGATLAYGGNRLTENEEHQMGYYLSPTLFTEVDKNMKIAKEEIFGPVLSVLTVDTVEEAIEVANATDYGLAASIFTNRVEQAQYVSEAVEIGMIHINHGTASQAHMPFGGWKQSGFGAFSIGHTNQDFYTSVKAVYTKSY